MRLHLGIGCELDAKVIKTVRVSLDLSTDSGLVWCRTVQQALYLDFAARGRFLSTKTKINCRYGYSDPGW